MTWLTDWLALIIYSAAASFKALLNGAVVIMMMWRGHWCLLIYKNTSIVCRVVSKPYRLWNTIIRLYIYKCTVAAVSFVSTTIKPLLYVAFFLNSTLRFFLFTLYPGHSLHSLLWLMERGCVRYPVLLVLNFVVVPLLGLTDCLQST